MKNNYRPAKAKGRITETEKKLAQANATLWQAYTLLHFISEANSDNDDFIDLVAAIEGVKALMLMV